MSTPDFGAGMFAPRSWSLSFGEGVGRIRRRFSFSVIRRPALVPAVPAVSCRVALTIGGARPAPEGLSTACVDSRFWRSNVRPAVLVFILWRRGRPHPAAVFFFGYSATGAGASCQLPGSARDRRRATCARGIYRMSGHRDPHTGYQLAGDFASATTFTYTRYRILEAGFAGWMRPRRQRRC